MNFLIYWDAPVIVVKMRNEKKKFFFYSECQQFYIFLEYDLFIKIMLFLQMIDYT